MTARYLYDPVNEEAEEIRLLTLLPGSFDDEVQLSIQVVTLTKEAPPIYEALSYVWGSKDDPRSICVMPNGTLSVTQNLATALQYLRYPDKPRIIWIDAICVNQENFDERGQQVQRMAEVYKHADRVVVWLGESDSDSVLAMQLLTSLASQIEVDWPLSTLKPSSRSGTCAEWADTTIPLPYDKKQLDAIHGLLHRPWFGRLWVRQEIYFADEKSIMMCGFDTMQWHLFRDALFCLRSKNVDWYALGSLERVHEFVRRREMIYKMYIYPGDSLGKLVRNMNDLECMDPRDRIFAVLSLLYGDEKYLPIKPDYVKPVGEVYQDVALGYIETMKSLDILRFSEIHDHSVGSPTWVPNFSVPMLTKEGLVGFRASGRSVASAEYLRSGILSVAGVRADVVNQIENLLKEQDSVRVLIETLIKTMINLAHPDIKNSAYVGGGSMLDAYSQTMVTHEVADKYLPADAFSPSVKSIQDIVMGWLQGKNSESEEFGGNLVEDRHKYLNRIKDIHTGRSFFTGKKGYIGLVPIAAEPGDEVCILLGCDSPVLLRPVEGGQYRFIGECYVHGLMNGEALLGRLPINVRPVNMFDEVYGWHMPVYLDDETGEIRGMGDDPRLEPLPENHGYQVDRYGPYIPQREGDPRLSVEALKERGVDLKVFELV